jgi:NAD(P)-dependent dehydrogenase (short-subunit alcohol dehydrogenase family)
MELSGKVVAVTGGASGIGRGLARRFAQEGARGVVVADLDADGARAVAEEIGENMGKAVGKAALGIGCDVAREDEMKALVSQTEEAFGPIDVFCANAGIGQGTDLDTPDDVWALAFDVNVKAHVLAARLLVPGWLERGEGYFVSTASAAGLLTQIGSAPYSVTKHGAVAFAEWLAVTYGRRGLRVSCLCPMGVNTAMLNAGLDAVDRQGVGARVVAATGEVLEPEDVAEVVVEAMREERFLILPHPEVLEFYRRKGSDYDRWIAGMQRLQATIMGEGAAS